MKCVGFPINVQDEIFMQTAGFSFVVAANNLSSFYYMALV